MNANKLSKSKINMSSLKSFPSKLQEKIATSPYSYLSLCFIVPALVMFLVYLAIGIHPFGDSSVLTLDLNGQYVYFYEALRNTVYGEGSMLYTFFRGLGGEFVGMYAYYLASPFSYIVALFPQKDMLDALLTIILLKVGCCGLTFGFYLHKNSKHQNKVVTIAFSLMYALCAYAVVYQNNIMWIDALIWLPLLTYGIEQLIKHSKYKLFVISLSMAIMSNFYIGYMLCIFVMLYYFYYWLAHSREQLNPHNRKLPFLMSFIRIAAFSLLAVAIAGFIVLGAYYSLGLGKNEFSDPNWSFTTKFDILDLFTKFLPGAYDTVRPQGLPFVYCGVLTLIMLPVYFLTKKVTTREKIASLGLICVFILSFIASPLDLIWHGFQAPNWLNYRYSFMLCFFLLVLAYKAFGNLRSVSEKVILAISAFIILFATVCDKLEFATYVKNKEQLKTLETVWLTVFVTVALLVVLCLLIRQKHPKKRENLAGVLAIIVCIEVFCSSVFCVYQHKGDVGGYVSTAGYTNYTQFLGKLRPIVSEIKNTDDGFYRMEKLVHRRVNDNMALGLRGLSNSTSTLNSETITFIGLMGYAARSHRSQYKEGSPVNDSLLGIKYLIDKKDSTKLTHLYEYVTTNGEYSAYENPYALSLAYGVDSSVMNFELDNNKYGTYFKRLNELVKAMVGNEYDKDMFIPVDRELIESVTSPSCQQTFNASTIVYTPSANSNSNYLTYSFIAPTSAQYYFHSPRKTSVETRLYVNGVDFGAYLGSDTNHMVSLGYFEKDEKITVKIVLDEKALTLYSYYDYFWYIDETAFAEAFGTLKSNPQYEITEYTEDNLIGTITTTENEQTILTTIPYDEGWKVYLDGEEVEKGKALNALISINIDTVGTHDLEFKYQPDIYIFGAILSISGSAIFIILCILDLIMYFVVIKKKRSTRFFYDDHKWVLEDIEKDHRELLEMPTEEKKQKGIRELTSKLFKKSKNKESSKKQAEAPQEGDK